MWIGGLFSGALLIPWGWQDCIPNDGISTHFIHLGFFFNLFLISRAVLDFLRFGFSQCESEGYKVVSCSFIPSKLRCCFMLFIKAPIRSCSCRNFFFFFFLSVNTGLVKQGPWERDLSLQNFGVKLYWQNYISLQKHNVETDIYTSNERFTAQIQLLTNQFLLMHMVMCFLKMSFMLPWP